MYSNADIVVAGHICLDIIPTFPDAKDNAAQEMFVPGGMVQMKPAVTGTGGAVSNTGLACHRLGVPTRLLGKVGGDVLGRATLDILRREGEHLAEGMIIAEDESSSYSVVMEPPGMDRCFLHYSGPNDTYGADDIDYDALQGARFFHFGYPTIMAAMRRDQGAELKRMFAAAKARGLTTSLDMSTPDPDTDAGRIDWRALLANVLPFVDIFMPSLPEVLFMLDRARFETMKSTLASPEITPLADGKLLHEVADTLLDLGTAVAGLKLGDQGLYVRTTADAERMARAGRGLSAVDASWIGREMVAPCFTVEVVGTTGAGDTSIAGFLAALAQNVPIADALTAASGTGAFCVEQADAVSGVPSWETLRARIEKGWQRRDVTISLDGWQPDPATGILAGPDDAGA